MKYLTFKNLLNTFYIFLAVFYVSSSMPVFAFDCELPFTNEAPGPTQIICPLLRVINFLYFVGGAFFVIMIFITAQKFATSGGDPKGIQQAKNSLYYSIYGFVALLLVFTISSVIGNTFGFNSFLNPNVFAEGLCESICDWIPDPTGPFGITDDNCKVCGELVS